MSAPKTLKELVAAAILEGVESGRLDISIESLSVDYKDLIKEAKKSAAAALIKNPPTVDPTASIEKSQYAPMIRRMTELKAVVTKRHLKWRAYKAAIVTLEKDNIKHPLSDADKKELKDFEVKATRAQQKYQKFAASVGNLRRLMVLEDNEALRKEAKHLFDETQKLKEEVDEALLKSRSLSG